MSDPSLTSPTPRRTIVFSLVFGLTVLIGYLFHQGYAPLAATAGFLCLPAIRLNREVRIGAGLALALAVWASITMVWSPAAPALSAIRSYDDLEKVTGLKLVVEAVLFSACVAGA